MKTMYEITSELADVLASMDYLNEQIEARAAEIEAGGGELPPDLAEQEAALTAKIDTLVGEEVPQKLENLALVRRDLKARLLVEGAQREALAGEAQRYAKRILSVKQNVDRLKAMSAKLFRMSGQQRVDGERIKTRVQAGPLNLRPVNPENPPHEFCREVWTMPARIADLIEDIVRVYDPGVLGEVHRLREFAPEYARRAVQDRLNGVEPSPGGSVTIDSELIASWAAVVVDW